MFVTYWGCKCIPYVIGTFVWWFVSMFLAIPTLGLISLIFTFYEYQLPSSQRGHSLEERGRRWEE